MTTDYKPESHTQALAMALILVITASNNEQQTKATTLAANIACHMTDEHVEIVKDSVEACASYFSDACESMAA